MSESDYIFKENVKLSFKKAKEHNIEIENSIKDLKTTTNSNFIILNNLKERIEEINSLFSNNKDFLTSFKSSTGNKGVLNNDKQQPTTTNNDKQCPTMINNDKQQPTTQISSINHNFSDQFSSHLKNKISSFENHFTTGKSLPSTKNEESLTNLNESNLLGRTVKSPLTSENSHTETWEKNLSFREETLTSEKNLKNNTNLPTIQKETLTSEKNKENFPFSPFNQPLTSEETTRNPPNLPKKPINSPQTLSSILSNLKEEVTQTLTSLTDREVSLLLAIHDLESIGSEASYAYIAQKLKLSENTIRVIVMSLLNKGAPLIKERYFNKKVSLSLKKEFKELNLLQKLMALHSSSKSQKTLFEI